MKRLYLCLTVMFLVFGLMVSDGVADPTCWGQCGGPAIDESCWCDGQCTFYGDCCDSYEQSCVDTGIMGPGIEVPGCPGGVTVRWCDQGDGTVKDFTTGLVWLKDASWGGQKPWRINSVCTYPDETCHDDAHTRAGILSAADVSAGLSDGSVVGDWRLPTREELHRLANGTEAIRCLNFGSVCNDVYGFTGVPGSGHYWSSTSEASVTNGAWFVSMASGFAYPFVKGSYYYVWPVRSDN